MPGSAASHQWGRTLSCCPSMIQSTWSCSPRPAMMTMSRSLAVPMAHRIAVHLSSTTYRLYLQHSRARRRPQQGAARSGRASWLQGARVPHLQPRMASTRCTPFISGSRPWCMVHGSTRQAGKALTCTWPPLASLPSTLDPSGRMQRARGQHRPDGQGRGLATLTRSTPPAGWPRCGPELICVQPDRRMERGQRQPDRRVERRQRKPDGQGRGLATGAHS